jgi:tripartite-type tricarboxylate transporter receptor subunit TctC
MQISLGISNKRKHTVNLTSILLKGRNFFLFMLGLGLLFTCSAHAQGLSIMVPYAAGGPSDAVARLMGNKLAGYFGGSPVNIENRLGEGGLIGLGDFTAQPVASQGVIFLNSSTFFLAVAKKPDQLDKIRPVSLVSLVPLVWVSSKPISALVEQAKQQGALQIGVSSLGSSSHLCAAQLANALGVKLQAIVYKGAAPLLADLLSGNADTSCIESNVVMPYFQQGKFKALAVSGEEGASLLPGIPTFEQLKLNGITRGQWSIIASQANASKDFVTKVSKALQVVLPGMSKEPMLSSQGYSFVPGSFVSPEKATSFVQGEFTRMKPYLGILSQ